jgi:hypothetical protein
MKTTVFFIALLLTMFFVNDKYSKGIRVVAFGEGESENGAKISFVLMILVAIAWTLFFAIA